MKNALPLKIMYKCPYCARMSEKQEDIIHCQGMCHLASLVDDEMVFQEGWNPPLPFNKFKEWSQGDRHELVRMLDRFAVKNYT